MSNLDKLNPLKTPTSSAMEVAAREKRLRRNLGLTQDELARKSGVSLGSLRRFEQAGQIQLVSLIRIMRALDCEQELDGLFSKRAYRSIEDVVEDYRHHGKQ